LNLAEKGWREGNFTPDVGFYFSRSSRPPLPAMYISLSIL
jgi:hypothetical protein